MRKAPHIKSHRIASSESLVVSSSWEISSRAKNKVKNRSIFLEIVVRNRFSNHRRDTSRIQINLTTMSWTVNCNSVWKFDIFVHQRIELPLTHNVILFHVKPKRKRKKTAIVVERCACQCKIPLKIYRWIWTLYSFLITLICVQFCHPSFEWQNHVILIRSIQLSIKWNVSIFHTSVYTYFDFFHCFFSFRVGNFVDDQR